MPALRELQRRFYAALTHERGALLEPHLTAASRARVDVYRNNYREGTRKTLRDTYPAVARLVGEACFRSLTRSYARRHPSRSGDLNDFGAGFARLLDGRYGATEFAYLGDVARLEWLAHAVLRATPRLSLDATVLGGVDVQDYARLTFSLQPGTALLSSAWPVLAIWEDNRRARSAARGPIRLDAGPDRLIVYRRARRLRVRRLTAAEFAFVGALAAGATLEAALDAAVGAEPDFAPAPTLAFLFHSGLPVSCSVSPLRSKAASSGAPRPATDRVPRAAVAATHP